MNIRQDQIRRDFQQSLDRRQAVADRSYRNSLIGESQINDFLNRNRIIRQQQFALCHQI